MLKRFFIILLFITSSYLYAQEQSNQYKEALEYYKQKEYAKSYDILSSIYLQHLGDVKFNYYLGRSAYESGHYTMALAAFERVDMLDPTNLRNKLELARTYFALKMYEDAENAFKDVLANPNIPQNVRSNIELYLSRVTKVQKKSFTYARVNLDWIYDSNVNYGSLGSFTYGGILFPVIKERSDTALQVYGDIVNIYDIGQKNGFAIKNHIVGYIKDYRDEDDYDIQYLGYMPSLLYKDRKQLMELVLGADTLSVAKRSYLNTLSIMPRYEYSHSDTLRSIAHYKYQKKSYKQEALKDMDADHNEVAYGLQKILSPRSYAQGNLLYINEAKRRGSRVDVDYNEYKASISYAIQLNAIVGLDLYGEYRERRYKEYNSGFGSKRIDNAGNAVANVNFAILQTLRFHVKTSYSRVNSNQDRYSYKKYTIALGINKTF